MTLVLPAWEHEQVDELQPLLDEAIAAFNAFVPAATRWAAANKAVQEWQERQENALAAQLVDLDFGSQL